MRSRSFLVESAALDLARVIEQTSPFEAPSTQDDLISQLLLSVVSSRIRWEVATAIVRDLVSAIRRRSRQGGGQHLPHNSTLKLILGRHRHPERIRNVVANLFADGGHALNEALCILAGVEAPPVLRRFLVAKVPGLGPKQASLLLRNIGRGERLAILDRHVITFMKLVGLLDEIRPLTTVAHYERVESSFVAYADFRQLPSDVLDFAVWIVMRTAKNERLS